MVTHQDQPLMFEGGPPFFFANALVFKLIRIAKKNKYVLQADPEDYAQTLQLCGHSVDYYLKDSKVPEACKESVRTKLSKENVFQPPTHPWVQERNLELLLAAKHVYAISPEKLVNIITTAELIHLQQFYSLTYRKRWLGTEHIAFAEILDKITLAAITALKSKPNVPKTCWDLLLEENI